MTSAGCAIAFAATKAFLTPPGANLAGLIAEYSATIGLACLALLPPMVFWVIGDLLRGGLVGLFVGVLIAALLENRKSGATSATR